MNVLIGLKTNKPGDFPLLPRGGKTSAVDRLRLFLGLSVNQFLRTFPIRLNVLDYTERGRRDLMTDLMGSVFVLGREAWRHIGLPRRGWFEVITTERARFILLPHPSGRSLVFNSKSMRERAKRTVYIYLEQEETDHACRSNRVSASGSSRGPPH
jgi:hypothetical protein